MKNVCFTLALLCINFIYSQDFTISGKLQDAEGISIESATVYVESVKDSSIIAYSISDKTGKFIIEGRTKEQKGNFFVTYTGMNPVKKVVDLTLSKIDLGNLTLNESAEELNEVIVTAARSPIQIKKDTLQFNANSFKTGADANVETLLKKLPGVTVDNDGNITVNGKKVSKILVNGKEFFGSDLTIATKNLPKEIVDKIQVVDTKTKDQAFTEEEGDKEDKTINITIKKDRNKGLFGRVTAGAGTNERYELSGILNYFNDKERLSVLGGVNNVNTSGFNNDEIKNMGGGRSYIRVNGVWTSSNPFRQNNSEGITRSATSGIHYANEWKKKMDLTTDYFYNDRDTKTASVSTSETFLPDDETYITDSNNSSDRLGISHNFNLEFEFKPDTLTRISIQPKIVKDYGDSYSSSTNERSDVSGLVNTSSTNNSSTYNNTSGGMSMSISRKLKEKGEHLSLRLNSNNSSNKSDDVFQSSINYFDNVTPNESVNQKKENESDAHNIDASLRISKKIKGNWYYTSRLNARYEESIAKRNTFDFNTATNSYDIINTQLTNDNKTVTSQFSPNFGVRYRNDSLSVRGGVGYEVNKLDNTDRINDLIVDRKFENVKYNLSFWKRFGQGKSMWVGLSNNVWNPAVSQLQPLVDNSNPLNIVQGNPDLKSTVSHQVNMSFNNFDMKTKAGYGGYAYMSFSNNSVVSKSITDANLVRYTTYENVDGNMNMFSNLHYSKSYKVDKHDFSWRLGADVSFNKNKNYSQDILYTTKTLSAGPEVSFTYNYNDIIEIAPRYSYNLNKSTYSIDTGLDGDFKSSELGVTLETFWPKQVEFSNDFRLTYNPNVSDGFTKNFYMWNASLGVKFLKNDRALFKVKVFDLLNQNTSVSRNSWRDSVEDKQELVLEQYFMFSLTYKVNKFKGNKKK